jgi:hypothetical protein
MPTSLSGFPNYTRPTGLRLRALSTNGSMPGVAAPCIFIGMVVLIRSGSSKRRPKTSSTAYIWLRSMSVPRSLTGNTARLKPFSGLDPFASLLLKAPTSLSKSVTVHSAAKLVTPPARMRSARTRIDRDIAAGVLRVAPIESSAIGSVFLPVWRPVLTEGRNLILRFAKGCVAIQGVNADQIDQELCNAGGDARMFREFALGFNPALKVLPE